MNSVELSNFFFSWIERTVKIKQYVEAVKISYERAESYGNEYIRIYYWLSVNSKFRGLSLKEQGAISMHFEEKAYYVFPLYKNTDRHKISQQVFLRLLMFKHIYESITALTILQLENHLSENVSIKVKGLDYWPDANYVEKYFKLSEIGERDYERKMNSDYGIDIRQYHLLHELAVNSRSIYRVQRQAFTVTDADLVDFHFFNLNDIRRILISYNVPIAINGIKTIDKIKIHTNELAKAIEEEIAREEKDTFFSLQGVSRLRYLLEYLHDYYLIEEKENLIQRQRIKFIADFPIQKGDLLQLSDDRLVVFQSIAFSEGRKFEIEYLILKNNLQKSVRGGRLKPEDVKYYLKATDFEEYKSQNMVKRISLLKKWMIKKRREIIFPEFI